MDLERLDPICTSKDPLRVYIDEHEAGLMTEALRPNAHRVALIVGCQKLEDIARAAGVHGDVPAVRSVVDVCLIELISGATSLAEKQTWYTVLARALLSRNAGYAPGPQGKAALVWTAQQLSMASEDLVFARKRRAAATADYRARLREC